MARQLRIEFPGAFYHITVRGNEKKRIFLTDRDREKFLEYLNSACRRFRGQILVYCCMENHFHLFLHTPLGNLSSIMHFINTAYTAYFNKKHERSGHLFQGRHKAILVDADEYAQVLSGYIHLNPVRAEIVQLPEQYEWLSYREYMGLRKTPVWLHPEFVLGYFGKTKDMAREEYAAFVRSILVKRIKSPLESARHSDILGNDLFIDRIKKNYAGDLRADREVPALKALRSDLYKETSLDEIMTEIEEAFGKQSESLKKVGVYFIHKYSEKKLREIGLIFGLSVSGVNSVVRRVEDKVSKDLRFGQKLREIERKLSLHDKHME
jgi:putative transposase